MANKNNRKRNSSERLLVKFLSYLWNNNTIDNYNLLVFGHADAVHLMGFTAETNYLLGYKRKHGIYPSEFQEKMNEWILETRL